MKVNRTWINCTVSFQPHGTLSNSTKSGTSASMSARNDAQCQRFPQHASKKLLSSSGRHTADGLKSCAVGKVTKVQILFV